MTRHTIFLSSWQGTHIIVKLTDKITIDLKEIKSILRALEVTCRALNT